MAPSRTRRGCEEPQTTRLGLRGAQVDTAVEELRSGGATGSFLRRVGPVPVSAGPSAPPWSRWRCDALALPVHWATALVPYRFARDLAQRTLCLSVEAGDHGWAGFLAGTREREGCGTVTIKGVGLETFCIEMDCARPAPVGRAGVPRMDGPS